MAARSTGNKTGRGGADKTNKGSTSASRSRQTAKTTPSTHKGSGRTTKATSASKTSAGGGVRTTRRVRPTGSVVRSRSTRTKRTSTKDFAEKYRSYLLGLTLGLVIGCLAALMVVYYPRREQARPAPKPPIRETAPTAPAPKTAPPTFYEEHQLFETKVKKLDHGLYAAVKVTGVPDQAIHFRNVISRKQGRRAWDYSVIEIRLPATLNAENLAAALRSAVKRLDLAPTPTIRTTRTDNHPSFDITYDGLKTHTLILIAPTSPGQPVTRPLADQRPKVAIVIDDFGLTLDEARYFLDIDLPLTFSILPFLDHSINIARMAHNRGREVLLHLPMQPLGWPEVDAGPGVLLVSMDEAEIRARTKAAIKAVPFTIGVNNHMGSRFTEDQQRMSWVLQELKSRNLFFLDSLTNNRSVALAEAKKHGVPVGQRSIFLDNIPDIQAIQIQLKKLVARAGNNGAAIGVGHVYPITCQALKKEYNYLTSEAMVVPLTALIH
jgi:uncharacterized protein